MFSKTLQAAEMSDYGVVPSHIQEYLHEVIGNAPTDVADEFAALLDLYSRKYARE